MLFLIRKIWVSPQSVEYCLDLIIKDKISIENIAEELAKPCVCGI